MIPLFLCVFVGHHVDGEGVINGCLSATAAGLGRSRWTTNAGTRGRSASSTLGRVVSCIATLIGIQLWMQSCVVLNPVSRTESKLVVQSLTSWKCCLVKLDSLTIEHRVYMHHKGRNDSNFSRYETRGDLSCRANEAEKQGSTLLGSAANWAAADDSVPYPWI